MEHHRENRRRQPAGQAFVEAVFAAPKNLSEQSQPILKGETGMNNLVKTLLAVAAGTVLATSAFAQSAKAVRGASPYIEITNEPAPKLIVDPPLAEALAQGIFWAQYRVENLRIVPVFGAGAVSASPRVGHLHVIVDDLPWWWADASDNNTIDIAGLPPGQHKVKIQLVDANHNAFPGQLATLTFTVPDYDRAKVYGHGH